jgi:hypothetical protein
MYVKVEIKSGGGIKIILKGNFRREFQDANLKGHFDKIIRAETPGGIILGVGQSAAFKKLSKNPFKSASYFSKGIKKTCMWLLPGASQFTSICVNLRQSTSMCCLPRL